VTLPTCQSWHDLYANAQRHTVTVGPASGMALVHSLHPG
jgi:hypothetical protein